MCCKCKIEREKSAFNKNKSKKDGLSDECRICTLEYGRKYRTLNKEKLLRGSREFKSLHRDEINTKNRERYLLKRQDEVFMKKKRDANLKYKSLNKGKVNSDTAKRYVAKMDRLAVSTKEELINIEDLYKEAQKLTRETKVPHHVDHIIPLQGKLVSGLHVLKNLQILTEQENCSKHNKYIV